MFKDKKVLITGGGGMIGRSLINQLIDKECKIYVADLTTPTDLPEGVEHLQVDLRFFDNCLPFRTIFYPLGPFRTIWDHI